MASAPASRPSAPAASRSRRTSARSSASWARIASSTERSFLCSSSIALTTTAMNRLSTTKVQTSTNAMKNIQARGCSAMTSRAMSLQASPVIIWNSVNSDVGRSPKKSGAVREYSLVAITAATYSTRPSSSAIEAMPGMAPSSAATTRRRLGTTEISRSARRMRSARSTVTPVAGMNEMTTIARSNRFHASVKKRSR